MFNLQPGMGLGFGPSKELAFGLGYALEVSIDFTDVEMVFIVSKIINDFAIEKHTYGFIIDDYNYEFKINSHSHEFNIDIHDKKFKIDEHVKEFKIVN